MRALSLGMILSLLSVPGFPCDCVEYASPEEAIENTDIVAAGRTIEAYLLAGEQRDAFIADHNGFAHYESIAKSTFEIEVPIKGAKMGEKIVIYYEAYGSYCAWAPLVGVPDILFVNDYDGVKIASYCAVNWAHDRETRDAYISVMEEMSGADLSTY